ncbi:MAG: serine hydrolase domain-containing protein [Lysobacterales bacterium]
MPELVGKKRWFVGALVAVLLGGCSDSEPDQPGQARLPATALPAYDAPDGWAQTKGASLTQFTAPEGDAHLAVVTGIGAADAVEAAESAWKQYDPSFNRLIRLNTSQPPSNGWDHITQIEYESSPAEEKLVYASVYALDNQFDVLLLEGNTGTIVKRTAAVSTTVDSFSAAGYTAEDLSNRDANTLSRQRIEDIRQFVVSGIRDLNIPGAAFALVQNGEVVFAGGVGVKDMETGAPVDADTLFMIASNTKGMTTLLLAKLVEMGKINWDDRVIDHYPEFKLGDAETTRSVLIRHLVCACTGLPRQDIRWIFSNDANTPASVTFDDLALTAPTSGFGELYQYNNQMAAAAGYVAGYVLYPDMELGAAYDKAMQTYIFDPLEMADTTFSIPEALASNHALPYALSLNDQLEPITQTPQTGFNHLVMAYRPAGAAWSSVRDTIKYVQNELSQGVKDNGIRLFEAGPLLERRKPFVPVSKTRSYGMGLAPETIGGVEVIRHGGSMAGYKSDIIIVPGANTGAVILVNADHGYDLAKPFGRKLIEVLYDGKPAAINTIAASVEQTALNNATLRDELTLPAAPDIVANLAGSYHNEQLGLVSINTGGPQPVLDTGAWSSPFATKKNADGTVSIVLTGGGMAGFPLVIGENDGLRTLTANDSQDSYVLTETDV